MLDTTFSERAGYRQEVDGERHKLRAKVLSGPTVMNGVDERPEVMVVVKLLESLPGPTLPLGMELPPHFTDETLIKALTINGDEVPEVGTELQVDYYTNYHRNGPSGHGRLSLGTPHRFTF